MTAQRCIGCRRFYSHCECDRPFVGAHVNGTPMRILDVLETDGGWLTLDGIADRLGRQRESVRTSLWRLWRRGLIENRTVEVTSSPRATTRTEWRLLEYA